MQQHQHHDNTQDSISVVPVPPPLPVPTLAAWGELSPTDAFDEEDGVVGIVIDGCPSNTSWERVCWLLHATTGICPIMVVDVESTEDACTFRAWCRTADAEALLGANGLALCFPDHVLGFWGGSARLHAAPLLLRTAIQQQVAQQGNAVTGSVLSVVVDPFAVSCPPTAYDFDIDPFLDANDDEGLTQRPAAAPRC